MTPTADLDTSLAYITRRIEEEAARSGEPLTDEQRFLLNHLPNDSALPIWNGADPEVPAMPVPRNLPFERLCELAGAAYDSDARLNSTALDWEFAFAVLKLNRHPMSWVLRWAGIKERRPWWDRWLLVVSALLVVSCFAFVLMIAGNDPWTRFQWTSFAVGYISALIGLYLVLRRVEKMQLKQIVEKCRRGTTFLTQ